MNDHASELRRFASVLGKPTIMLDAADEIERLAAKLEAAEKERDDVAQQLVQSEQGKRKISEECDELRAAVRHEADCVEACKSEIDALRAKIEAMEKQEPVAEIGQQYTLLFVGSGSITGVVKRHGLKIGDKLYALPGAQNVPDFADAYQGAMEEVAIWKKRALEAEGLNRKFIAEINGPTYMGEPAQPAPSVPDGFALVNAAHFLAVLDREDWRTAKNRAELRAMLAAAPEAKP